MDKQKHDQLQKEAFDAENLFEAAAEDYEIAKREVVRAQEVANMMLNRKLERQQEAFIANAEYEKYCDECEAENVNTQEN